MIFRIKDFQKYPEIQERYERLNPKYLMEAFGLPESGDKKSLQTIIE